MTDMKSFFNKLAICVSLLVTISFASATAQPNLTNLRCEYKENPVGIDTEKPRLSWQLQSDERGGMQSAYRIRVARSESDLENNRDLIWDSGKVSSGQSIHVPYEGPDLQSGQRVYWQVRVWDQDNKLSEWSNAAFWEMGLLSSSDWQARWITPDIEEDITRSEPAPYIRKEFELTKPVESARIYVTALGLYELQLNGEKVGDQVFTPGWTSYNQRLQYQVYDVTNQLKKGANALAAVLGDGWYRGHMGWGEDIRNQYGSKLGLLMQLEVTYRDGSEEIITTDRSWTGRTGPIRKSDIYNGETYDARLEFENWSQPDFSGKGWKKVKLLDHTKETLVASVGDPVKKIQELKPVRQITTPKGEEVFDLGQNMVGWARLKVKGSRGDTVTLKFAEALDKEGNFYTGNLRGAENTDRYILKGGGEELYEPRFTFHGFRYVKVEGYPGRLTPDAITGIVIHSDIEPTGTFTCSNPQINQLQQNIQWGQKGNFLDVPTDCPQRDERLGWTGDAQVFAPTASFNFDVAAFFSKWMKDLSADQLENGSVPDVIPDVLNIKLESGFKGKPAWAGSTGWGDAAIIIPWTMYLSYGDERILEQQYPSMKKWVSYMQGRAGDDLLWTGDEHYGDWLSYNTTDSDYPGAYTEKDFLATAYFAYSTRLIGRIARILGKEQEAKRYDRQYRQIREAFNKEYVTPNGRLMSNTQTAYVLALEFDLLPDHLTKKAAAHLAENVREFGHITTGFLGTPLICHVLTKYGYIDLAYHLLNRKDYPSWLYPVTQGATTIWERWDGIRPDGSFQDEGMNSLNHYAYGAIGDWLYKVVAGLDIDPEHPGYKKIIFHPHPGGGLTNARATLETMYGRAESGWEIRDGEFIYRIQVPANTSARVTLPGADASGVREGENQLADIPYIKNISEQSNNLTFDVASGSYEFRYPLVD